MQLYFIYIDYQLQARPSAPRYSFTTTDHALR